MIGTGILENHVATVAIKSLYLTSSKHIEKRPHEEKEIDKPTEISQKRDCLPNETLSVGVRDGFRGEVKQARYLSYEVPGFCFLWPSLHLPVSPVAPAPWTTSHILQYLPPLWGTHRMVIPPGSLLSSIPRDTPNKTKSITSSPQEPGEPPSAWLFLFWPLIMLSAPV